MKTECPRWQLQKRAIQILRFKNRSLEILPLKTKKVKISPLVFRPIYQNSLFINCSFVESLWDYIFFSHNGSNQWLTFCLTSYDPNTLALKFSKLMLSYSKLPELHHHSCWPNWLGIQRKFQELSRHSSCFEMQFPLTLFDEDLTQPKQ